jgi:hypothetical protein
MIGDVLELCASATMAAYPDPAETPRPLLVFYGARRERPRRRNGKKFLSGKLNERVVIATGCRLYVFPATERRTTRAQRTRCASRRQK